MMYGISSSYFRIAVIASWLYGDNPLNKGVDGDNSSKAIQLLIAGIGLLKVERGKVIMYWARLRV